MARNHGKNFFVAHWDWLVAALGLLLVVLSYVLNFALGGESVKKASRTKGGAAPEPVAAIDLMGPDQALARFDKPGRLAPVDPKGSFLASRARTFCTPADGSAGCGAVLLPEAETCEHCQKSQKEASEKLVLDRDEDGMTDAYEIANGLNPEVDDREDDLDGDGFTNFEEFEAKTKPNDPLDHPDYFSAKREIVKVVGKGNPTTSSLFFIDRTEYKIGEKGNRFTFYDPTVIAKAGKKKPSSENMTAFIGEEIKFDLMSSTGKALKPIETGFILSDYTEKIDRVQAKGASGNREIDRSYVTLKRKSDGALFKFERTTKKEQKKTVLDAKAKIRFDGLRDVEDFEVGKGDKIDLSKYGATYTVMKVSEDEKNPEKLSVTIKNDANGELKVLLSE